MIKGFRAQAFLEFAEMLLNVLKRGRLDGTITPKEPINSTKLIQRYNLKFKASIENGTREILKDSTIRKAAGYLRGERGEPIASQMKSKKFGKKEGYFYAVDVREYDAAMMHYRRRLEKMHRNIEKPRRRLMANQTENAFETVIGSMGTVATS